MLSLWGKRIKSFYEKGYYTDEEVLAFVPKFLEMREAELIIGV